MKMSYYEQENLSPVREQLWELLETAEVPMGLIEFVDRVVAELESQVDAECPTCQALSLLEEAKFAQEAWR